MPMQRDRYPADWEQISLRIRERAGQKCEECGVPHGALILRSKLDKSRWLMIDPEEAEWMIDSEGQCLRIIPTAYLTGKRAIKWTVIILTTHHKGVDKADGTPGDPDDKMDCRDENLAALCQHCHLEADRPRNIAKAKLTRSRKKREVIAAARQRDLFDEFSDLVDFDRWGTE